VGAGSKPVGGNLVGDKENPAVVGTLVEERCTAQTEHKRSAGEGRDPAVAEENMLAGGKESLVVGGMAFLAVMHTAAEGMGRHVAGGMVSSVVADRAAAHIQAEKLHTQTRPGVAETA